MEVEPTEGQIQVKEKYQDKQEFTVRAHHLAILLNFRKSGLSVGDFANTFVASLEKKRASGHISRNRKWYINDVLGNTQEQVDKSRRNEREFLEEFLQLPPDYPVKIAEDQKDKFCEGCAIGEHCSKGPIWLIRWGWEPSTDKIFIELFRKIAKELKLEDTLTVVDEIATYSNAKPRKVKSILTTAGTVKKVLLQ